MRKNYFNGKYNIILSKSVNLRIDDKDSILRTGELSKICYDVKKEELDMDEVFNGNLYIGSNFNKINLNKIKKISLKNNLLYTKSFNQMGSYIDNTLLYCDSFTFWTVGNFFRTTENWDDFYSYCRLHRIKLGIIPESCYEEV